MARVLAGLPMSLNQLANLLRPFKIKPGTIRVDDPVQGSMTPRGTCASGSRRLGIAICRNRPLSIRNIATSHGRRGFQQFSIRHTRFGCYGLESPESHGHGQL